jgi:hypothetical protein
MLNGRSLSPLSSALVLVLALLAPSAAPAEPQARPAAPDPAGAAQSVPPASSGSKIVPTPTVEPPDGKWLKDKDGKEYFVYAIPRVENNYEWVEKGKRVRVEYGLVLQVDHYDDKNFYVRYYRPNATPLPAPHRLTDEDRRKVAETYKTDVRPSDRLRFVPFDKGLPVSGQWREGFAVADINRDGHLDIVHGPARKSGSTSPNVFLGDGKGGWSRWPLTVTPRVPFDYGDVAVGDLNGDGIPDLVVASHLRGITALVGDGKGGFKPWSQGIDFRLPGGKDKAPPPFSSRAIAIVDWNGDGRPDILAVGEGPVLATARGPGGGEKPEPLSDSRGAIVYLNNGDGTWTRRTAAGPFTDTLAVADFNGDGHPDFFTGSSQLGVQTLLNLGQPDGSWKTVAIDELRPRALYFAAAAADFNRDGRPDLAVAYMSNEGGVWRTGVDVLLNLPGMRWERHTVAAAESSVGIWSLAAGDLDGDGNKDLVAFDGDGKAWVFLGDGKGGFTREESPELGPAEGACRGYHVVLADLDGDGKDELVASFAGDNEALPIAGALMPVTCRSGGSIRAWKAVPKGGG